MMIRVSPALSLARASRVSPADCLLWTSMGRYAAATSLYTSRIAAARAMVETLAMTRCRKPAASSFSSCSTAANAIARSARPGRNSLIARKLIGLKYPPCCAFRSG